MHGKPVWVADFLAIVSTAVAEGRCDSLARPVEGASARKEGMYHRRQAGDALLALRLALHVCA